MQQNIISRALRLVRGGSGGNQAAPVVTVEGFNNSGGDIAAGDVVVWDRANSTADQIYFKTTTGANDLDVLGVAVEAIISVAVGKIQIWGPISTLKVDGTTDIVAGDYLGTYTTAKIAAKTSGTGSFGFAMEGYTTNDSNGVIDAFIWASTPGV